METKELFEELNAYGINFFCGVPDSLLKDFCAYITDNTSAKNHIITANEGNAIGLACGHYLATQKPALVYMQNSGVGNTINPLLSLADEEVYNIPILLLVGWRGEPNIKDEPQHKKQGKVTDKIFDACEIKHEILEKDFRLAKVQIKNAIDYMKKNKKPFVLIVRKGTFEKYNLKNKQTSNAILSREEALGFVLSKLSEDDIIVSTTGQLSRELYEYREKHSQTHKQDFLTVGSMGHSSSIALGIALEKSNRRVFCLDGDGAALMHLGSLPVVASTEIKNFKHIIFNNEAHDSVGAQPTCASNINFKNLALSCGYKKAVSVSTNDDLKKNLDILLNSEELSLLEIKVKCGARDDLGRPKETPIENKNSFISFLEENKTFCAPNSIKKLNKILKRENVKKAIVFTGKSSFNLIKHIIDEELKNVETHYYSDFSTNPKANEVEDAITKLPKDFDIIIAIGGGSVIDFAKLFKFVSDNKMSITDYFETKPTVTKKHKLIAIPTTAGTGAEATKFAVVYVNGEKQSLDDISLLPDYAIVDSNFIIDVPKSIKASCAMDAFCQAIEAFWSVNSTKESDEFAQRAIELCEEYLVDYVNNSEELAAQKMAQASNFAGKAINIAKTTAAHALSYKITTAYNVAHGAAVCCSIAKLAKMNYMATEKDIIDPRGYAYVQEKMLKLAKFLKIKPDEFESYLTEIIEKLGIKYKLSEIGVKNIEEITQSVNINRLKNNPVKLQEEDLKRLFTF